MKRLRDEIDAGDPEAARMARLLAHAAPFAESAARMARVRRALDEPRRRPAAAWALRPAVVVAMALGVVAIAGAAVGRHFLLRPAHAPAPERLAPRPPAPVPVPAPVPAPVPVPVPVPAPVLVPVPAPVVAPAPAPAPVAAPPPRQPARHKPAKAAPPAPALDPAKVVEEREPDFETQIVHDAVQALRRDNDPSRAAMLLRFYLKKSPDGPLAEEALALAVEATRLEHPAESAALGRHYLARYPGGRFRAQAERAVAPQ